ncbi:MAG TPA: hypothetical protein PLP23_01165 [Panacibacter sp.]|nr:hypothetical protein [Panacibacter sp.]
MTLADFQETIKNKQLPDNISVYLKALWYDASGKWDSAHKLIDHLNDATACWVHAYLHRKEGDNSNARYWYNRAGKNIPSISLEEEWRQIVKMLL